MCLIFFALHQHPTYKLILAGNRDEFYARKTEQAHFWGKHQYILGGCDLEAIKPDGTCGTWMGITKNGRLAFITNYRDPHNINPKAPSRGHLVSDFLVCDQSPANYIQAVADRAAQYNGFNLVVGDANDLHYFSNYQNEVKTLSKGFYGLSNHLLDTPWPKVVQGKKEIGQEIKNQEIDVEQLFTILRNEHRAVDHQLPNTGIGLERERALSSMFIKTNGYGTRCSTIILVNHSGETIFLERTYSLNDITSETRKFEFKIQN